MKNRKKSARPRWPYLLLILPALVLIVIPLIQGPFAHRVPPFVPDYPMVDLAPILSQETLSNEDYDLLFLQTGLSPAAVDRLRFTGEVGNARISDIQSLFFSPVTVTCNDLFGPFTKEDHMVDDAGQMAWGPSLADLQKGDIILTFSTHSFGWRHGHAGIVVDDTGEGITLEAVRVGTASTQIPAWHWRNYSNFAVLRLKDITPELQDQVAAYALEHLDGIPYHLSSGFLGSKAPAPDAPWFGVQCDYLVWYAYQHFGYDLDSDGGPLVTTADLFSSPLLEVVQVYGMDPRTLAP